jgi:uncharacterized membrane-anchored protein YitT (DUF2179 family)
MKKVFNYLAVILGCELIALSFVLLILPNKVLSFGIDGVGALLYYTNGVNPGINILVLNAIFILISLLVLDIDEVKKYILPSLLIPILIMINMIVLRDVTIELPELVVSILVSSFLIGFGYSLIYKNGHGAGNIFLIEETIGEVTKFRSKAYSWILDILILIVLFITNGYMAVIYSLIIIFASKYLITKARFGINDSKIFYVITSKENEVKDFIIRHMKYELTVLDVKGGYSQKKNQILLAVISSKDYFKLKEGIKTIDPDAFIAITDTYESMNLKTF